MENETNKNKGWTPEDDAIANMMHAMGYSTKKISGELKRTTAAVSSRLTLLKDYNVLLAELNNVTMDKISSKNKRHNTEWTDEEVYTMICLAIKGYSDNYIGAFLNREPHAVELKKFKVIGSIKKKPHKEIYDVLKKYYLLNESYKKSKTKAEEKAPVVNEKPAERVDKAAVAETLNANSLEERIKKEYSESEPRVDMIEMIRRISECGIECELRAGNLSVSVKSESPATRADAAKIITIVSEYELKSPCTVKVGNMTAYVSA